MADRLTLAARLSLDNQRYVQGLAGAQTKTRAFAGAVRREIGELSSFMTGTMGKLASYGAGFAIGTQIVKSAHLDKTLTQIGQTASASELQVKGLRGELFRMAAESGRNVDDLQAGYSTLIAGGLKWAEALPTLNAVNKTMAVTGAQAETLAGTLGVASTAFKFDLSQPKTALTILDKMTVAGRQGNAELENLGSIFSRVGVNAGRAGFGFDQTLAFIEGLSMIERQPERLATLADSTLRLFTNAKYMADSQKASGVRFFDKATGDRRDPLVVLAELKKKMDAMKTDAQREGFLTKAFGNADLDTIKGLSTLLTGNSLEKIGQFTAQIGGAGGTIERDLPKAIANAVDQTGRLKARLKDAADAFAQPINAAVSKLLAGTLKPESEGGLSNAGLFGAGAGALAGTYILKRMLGGIGGRLFGGAASLAGGVAMGTALEKAGAASPVFIVGAAPGVFPGGLGGVGGLAGSAAAGAVVGSAGKKIGTAALLGMAARNAPVSSLARLGVAGAATVAGGTVLAGAGGYAVGTGMYNLSNKFEGGRRSNDNVGRDIAKILAFFGNDNARSALTSERRSRAAAQAARPIAITRQAQAARVAGGAASFANVRGGYAIKQVSAAEIGAAVSKAIATQAAQRPLRGELHVRVTDTRTTVTAVTGPDFTNTRSTYRRTANTGRVMADR